MTNGDVYWTMGWTAWHVLPYELNSLSVDRYSLPQKAQGLGGGGVAASMAGVKDSIKVKASMLSVQNAKMNRFLFSLGIIFTC